MNRIHRAVLRGILFSALVPALSGCVSAGIGGATYAVKASQRGALEEKAAAGNAQAQYRLGLANCCMGVGFSAQTATEWLCKAAAQNYPPAQYELGRIYAGETSRTPGLGRKVRQAAFAQSDPVSSYVWFKLAADGGEERAIERVEKAGKRLSEAEMALAESYLADWPSMACEYDQVFIAAKSDPGMQQ